MRHASRYDPVATRRCLERRGFRVGPARRGFAASGALVVRTSRGDVGLTFLRSAAAAQALAQASGGPGDPYGYRAAGNVVLQWPSGRERAAAAVEACLRR